MADRLNPADQTAAESDYQKKFNKQTAPEAKELKEKETTPDTEWKTTAKKKDKTATKDKNGGNGRFSFAGRKMGKLRNGSAFAFIIGLVALGVMYTSVFAPNIILVNLKEMYVNDLADATLALNSYYWKLMDYKIGQSDCGDKKSIKCKLSTMSRAQQISFTKHGFTVLGSKVDEDNRDDGQPGNEKTESRYQVTAIIPPVSSPGLIISGDTLYLYSQLSSANKSLVYGVFNPKSGFFMDARFKERLKQKYGLTKNMSVGGDNVDDVNKSFDASLVGSGGISTDGRPNPSGGVSLATLGNPTTLAQYQVAAQILTKPSSSFVGLQCAWNALGKAVTNSAQTAQAQTLARFAMNYLQAADQVKTGTSQDVTINTLSSNLAQSTGGGYDGSNATDSTMYKSITYGGIALPSPYGFLYSENTFDIIGALFPAWTQIMASSAAQGQASGVQGQLSMPPADLAGGARDYCLAGETTQNHSVYKTPDVECQPQIIASAPPGLQSTLEPMLALARQTCPNTHYDQQDRQFEGGPYNIQPSLRATDTPLTAYVAGIFGANVLAWANVKSLLFSHNTKGVAASDAIFAGTGEILGDMAMSRGMEPANLATMGAYLVQKDSVQKNFDDVARYNAKQTPFDIYNKFSFLGSIVHGLNPTYNSKTPLFSTISNSMSLLTDSVRKLNPNANAFYFEQPEIPEIDPLNPSTAAQHATGIAQYLTRLTCPDPEYLAILINADTACNVRYVMGKQELLKMPGQVIDYMTQSHSDLTQKNIDELQQRLAQADPDDGEAARVGQMLTNARDAANKPQIDKETGRAITGSEYEKFLDYCVNRRDPWGRSSVAIHWNDLSNEERIKRLADKANGIDPVSPSDSGDPYEQSAGFLSAAITEGASQDQDWYTGKKCLEQSDELTNFRAFTMLCSVDGSLSGGVDCTDNDNYYGSGYANDFYTSNDILFLNN
jgi:hypothetical protein